MERTRALDIKTITAESEKILVSRPLKTACQELTRFLKETGGYFWVGIYLRRGDIVERLAFAGPIPPFDTFPLGVGNVGWVGQHGRLKVIPDVKKDPQYSTCFANTKSEIVVPIVRDGEVKGVIDIESDKPNYFGKQDVQVLTSVASRISHRIY